MWTHRHPYQQPALTREALETRTRLGLYSALQSRRLVAMVGSGITAPYGLPSWGEVISLFAKKTKEAVQQCEGRTQMLRATERQVVRQSRDLLEDLLRDHDFTDSQFLLETCDAILKELPISDDGKSARLKVREEFCEELWKKGIRNPSEPRQMFVSRLLEQMAIRRIFTLNYDTAFERHIIDEALKIDGRRFKISQQWQFGFNHEKYPGPNVLPRRMALEDGIRRMAISTTLVADDLSEIVEFAAFPRRYDYQVFHLHGRLDDPHNIILTQDDYKRMYLRNGDARQSFAEAQQVLFGGNDILFLGVGMNEAEVLAPLRQFLSHSQRSIQTPQRIFAILPSAGGDNWRIKNHERAVELLTNYGVHTLFHSGDEEPASAEFRSKAYRSGAEDEAVRLFGSSLGRTLDRIVEGSERWWDDSRQTPAYRRSKFRQSTPKVGAPSPKNPSTIWVRHYPEYDVRAESEIPGAKPDHIWTPIKHLQELGTQTCAKSSKKGRRIVRAAIPRGGGTGSLFHLLIDPKQHESIFLSEKKRTAGKHQPYCGAFFANLSFSSEFSSVIKGLARFLAGRIASLADDWEEKEWVSADGLTTANKQEDWINACEDEPERALNIRDDERTGRVRRLHRLVVVRELLHSWQKVSGQGGRKSNSRRLLIVINNIHHLCDKHGNAFSPMHRALFRLLAGTAETKDEGLSINPPIDIILLSGNPDVPTNYLSEIELPVEHKYVRTESSPIFAPGQVPTRPNIPATHALPPPRYQSVKHTVSVQPHGELGQTNVFLNPETGLRLRRWPTLHQYSWEERAALAPHKAFDQSDWQKDVISFLNYIKQDRLALSEDKLKKLGLDNSALEDSPRHPSANRTLRTLRQHLWDDHMSFVLTLMCWRGRRRSKRHQSDLEEWEFLVRLNRSLERRGVREFLNQINAEYEDLDNCSNHGGGSGKQIDGGLLRLITRHLALFTVPVEISVLSGCPKIYDLISKLYPDRSHLVGTVSRYKKRGFVLRTLVEHLAVLQGRGLVIAVRNSYGLGGTDTVGSDEAAGSEKEFHRRYALHPRLREYFAKAMSLARPDGGESEHFQVSLHCDQPKDIPTPSSEHFLLANDIVNEQVRLCRQTLSIPYALHASDRWQSQNKTLVGLAANSTIARIFEPDGSGLDSIAGGLGRIHSVPQRLRGTLSLVRGTFSLGSISRLNWEGGDESEKPLETYHGWIRSLLNAATSLTYNRKHFGKILKEDGFVPKAASAAENGVRLEVCWSDFLDIKRQTTHLKHLRHPYYIDEVLWLYNEQALTRLMQGELFEAANLFDQALFLAGHEDSSKDKKRNSWTRVNHSYNSTKRRILLNKAICEIEMGNIERARTVLEGIVEHRPLSPHATPSRLVPFAKSYLGLCNHLSGSFELATKYYSESLEVFAAHEQLRAASVTNRFWAHLLLAQGQTDMARHRIQLSIGAAAHAEQQDITHWAKLAAALIELSEGNGDDMMAQSAVALNYSDRMGLFALKADALISQADALRSKGELGLAGEAVSDAVALCNRHGALLRKLRALETYSQILLGRGEKQLARRILKEMKRESERIGYQTRAAKAASLLSEMGQ